MSELKILAIAGYMSLYESNISEHISSYISNITSTKTNMRINLALKWFVRAKELQVSELKILAIAG